MNNLKLVDLNREFKFIKNEVLPKITYLLSESKFILGKELETFEKEFARYCQAEYCVGVSSGTAALFLGLKACGIGKGDEVITTTMTFTATAEAIIQLGAKPIFVDIEPNTMSIDVSQIEEVISKRTKAIIPVHLYGLPADIEKISKICKKYKLFLIEDASQAHGAKYKHKKTGSLGDVGCFSFMPAKNLGTYGDGGCIVTNHKRIYDKIRLWRNHGRVSKYNHYEIGYSERLDNVLAAVLSIKLKHLDKWNKRRNQIATLYNKLLDKDYITFIDIPKGRESSYYVYTISVKKNRDNIRHQLNKLGIPTGVYYPIPLHLQKAYEKLKYKKGDLPVAEQICSSIFSLPMHPFLKDSEVKKIAKITNEIVKKLSSKIK